MKYFNYIFHFFFFQLIIFKLNKFFFEIPFLILFVVSILLFSFFIHFNQFLINTKIFNNCLYCYLIAKDIFYYYIFVFLSNLKLNFSKIVITNVITFFFFLYFLQYLYFHSEMNLLLLLITFVFLLTNQLENYLFQNIIFKNKQIDINKKLTFNYIQNNLGVNSSIIKNFHNRKLFYVQKRYVANKSQLLEIIKNSGINLTTLTAVGAFLGGLVGWRNIDNDAKTADAIVITAKAGEKTADAAVITARAAEKAADAEIIRAQNERVKIFYDLKENCEKDLNLNKEKLAQAKDNAGFIYSNKNHISFLEETIETSKRTCADLSNNIDSLENSTSKTKIIKSVLEETYFFINLFF